MRHLDGRPSGHKDYAILRRNHFHIRVKSNKYSYSFLTRSNLKKD